MPRCRRINGTRCEWNSPGGEIQRGVERQSTFEFDDNHIAGPGAVGMWTQGGQLTAFDLQLRREIGDDPPRCSRAGAARLRRRLHRLAAAAYLWRSGWASSKSGSSAPPRCRLGAGDARGGALGHRFSIRRLLLAPRSSCGDGAGLRGPHLPSGRCSWCVRRHAQPEQRPT